MSRSELVQNYLDGQLSRRVFIRGMIATGVSAAAALSYAGLLEAAPAGATVSDYYLVIADFAFTTPVSLEQAQGVEFANHGNTVHRARADTGVAPFDTGDIPPSGAGFIAPLPGAGIYPYHCVHHTSMTGRLRVPILATPSSAGLGTTFTIRWADASVTLPAGRAFDVQRRRPGAANFTAWRTGVTAKAANVTPTQRGDYAFRARLRRTANGVTSLWSLPATIHVS